VSYSAARLLDQLGIHVQPQERWTGAMRKTT
jgi:3-polyprenyl-4-hydroxybenzoate decarboxylase